jgi:hypothetical protein
MKGKDQQLLEEAYTKIVEEVSTEQEFSYYSGPTEDIMFLNDMEDVSNLKRKVQDGKHFKTAFVAFRKDAVNYGYPDQSGHEYYVFYTPQDFTHAALIPV